MIAMRCARCTDKIVSAPEGTPTYADCSGRDEFLCFVCAMATGRMRPTVDEVVASYEALGTHVTYAIDASDATWTTATTLTPLATQPVGWTDQVTIDSEGIER